MSNRQLNKMLVGGISGAISGLLGGRGTGSAHTSNSFSRVLKNKNVRYYFTQINKQAVKDGKKAIPGIIKSAIPNVIGTLACKLYHGE